VILQCNSCNGNNVLQEACVLIDWRDLDEPDFGIELGELLLSDHYYCMDCAESVRATKLGDL